jgi:hypothetical protein
LRRWLEPLAGRDFLKAGGRWDWAVGNPPFSQSGEAATEVITAEYAEYAERRAARFGIPRIPRILRLKNLLKNERLCAIALQFRAFLQKAVQVAENVVFIGLAPAWFVRPRQEDMRQARFALVELCALPIPPDWPRFGIERLPQGKKRRRLERALKFLRADYAGKILDFSEGAAVEWGRLVAQAQGQGRNLSVPDSQIEATAVHSGLTVVTRNRADFFHPVFSPREPDALPRWPTQGH